MLCAIACVSADCGKCVCMCLCMQVYVDVVMLVCAQEEEFTFRAQVDITFHQTRFPRVLESVLLNTSKYREER